jgi:aspartate dehydrogenase
VEPPLRIAVIGYGAIGRFLISQLRCEPAIDTCAVLSVPRPDACSEPVVEDIEELLSTRPDLVVECAGHSALRTFGESILRHGTDLLVVSVGALADPEIEAALRAASASGGGKLLIAGGALGGIDALSAAREAGLTSVDYIGRKAPAAWKGTAAEKIVQLDRVVEPYTFIDCEARTAALTFPQNANVVAAIALAGLGFDKTRVRLIVDPEAEGNFHSYVARGAFGEISTTIRSKTLEANPKTSVLAPYSLVQTIKKRSGLIPA